MTAPATLPVIFRADRSGEDKGVITAVFPTLGGTGAHDFTVYEHMGQHSSGTLGWYRQRTRAAKPSEYAPLLAELRRIYGREPDPVTLRIVQRFHPAYHRARKEEFRRYR